MRCGTCRAEFLVAFRCKGRQFCPSCHARRLAEWSAWLDGHLLARVAHRQVVLTVPKRLRAYFVRDPRRLGLLSRIATRTLRAYVRRAVGEADAVAGPVVCVQTFGSVAHFHPHLHVLMTDGAYGSDGMWVALGSGACAESGRSARDGWQRGQLGGGARPSSPAGDGAGGEISRGRREP